MRTGRRLALLLCCVAMTVPSSAREICAVREATEADAMRAIGKHLNALSPQDKKWVKVVIASTEIRSESERLVTMYPIAGKDARSALDSLRAKGFTCNFEVLDGIRTGKSGMTFEPAALPVYRCTKVDAGSCLCRRKQITFGPGSQAPGQPVAAYRQLTDAMVLASKDVNHTCHSADE